MELTLKDGLFVFRCSYEERDIPKQARFWFDPQRKAWVTSSTRCAAKLARYADQAARARIVDRFARMPEQREYTPSKVGRFGNHR